MDKKRILVVDDQDTWLKTIQTILGDQYELSLTDDPEEAIALSRASPFSLAILDQRIAVDVSGLDLLERLHGIQQDIRCIILTGYADLDDAVKSLHGGALDYLSKGRPDLAKDLRDRVAKILETKTFPQELLSILRTQVNSAPQCYRDDLYVPQCIQLVHADGREENVADAVSTVQNWLRAEGSTLVFILGAIGVGKTFFLYQLARQLIKDEWDGAALFIRLDMLGNAKSLDSLISQHLSDLEGDRIDLARIGDRFKQGRLILFLDGYDESIPFTTYEQAARHLETIVSSISGNAKVVVTSRAEHFSSDEDLLSHLRKPPGFISNLRLCTLLPFSEEQASASLHKRLEETAAVAWRQLTYAPEDSVTLVRNPRMLALLAAVDKSMLLRLIERVDYPTDLIGVLTSLLEGWWNCEDEKKLAGTEMQVVSSAIRSGVLAAIAGRMWHNKLEYVTEIELVEESRMIARSLGLTGIDPEHLAHSIGARSLLCRDRSGRFSFIDRAIMEWFVVSAAADEMRYGLAPESLLDAPISQRMYDILVCLAGQGACVAWAHRITSDPERYGVHATALAAKALQDFSKADSNERPFIPQFPWLQWLNNRGDESVISRLAIECFQTPVIRVRALRIRNVRVFEDTGEIRFCDDNGITRVVTLIVGDNAAGKSTLLQCLAIAFLGPALASQLNISVERLLRHGASSGFIEAELEFQDQSSMTGAPSSFFVGIELRAGETSFRSADRSDCLLLNGHQEDSDNAALRIDAVRRLGHGGFGFLCAYGPWRTLNVEPNTSRRQPPIKILDRVYSLFHSETLVMDPDLLRRMLSGQGVTANRSASVELDDEMKRLLCETICDVVPNLSIAEEQEEGGLAWIFA